MAVAAAGPGGAAVLLELGAVIFGLAVLARVAVALGVSPIPLYLLAGLAIGEGGVVELVTAEDFIEVGASIGVVLLLLLLGLEYSGDELLGSLRAHAPAGLVDFLLNFTPGAVAALLLGWGAVAAVLFGGVTYISSSGVVAKVLHDLGRIGNRETPAVLSILVIEDLAMAAYLPVVAGLLSGAGALGATAEVAGAMAVVAVVLLVAVRYGAALSRTVVGRSDEVLLLTVLGATFLVAGVAEQLQASSAVGAFLVGLALSGTAAHRARRLLSPLRDLFAGVFFVFFGLRLDPAELPPVLGVAVALAVLTAATKVATGWWAAARAGVGVPGRLRAGTALAARGEFSIVIAALAVAEGVEADLGTTAAAYVIVLAVTGPLLARAAEPLARAFTRARGA